MQILIVNNNDSVRHQLSSTLTGWGYAIKCVETREASLEILLSNDPPGMVFIGETIPKSDIDEMCRLVQSSRSVNRTYIIIMVTHSRENGLEGCLEAGADDFLVLPIENSSLKARIRAGERILGLTTALNDMTERAMHDPLTGVLNRLSILDLLDRELIRSKRTGSNLSIGLIDIDHFKKINDTYGHLTGDLVLKTFTKQIEGCLRGSDLMGRYGGEEFLVIAPDSTGTSCQGLYERLREGVESLRVETDREPMKITISIGVAGSKEYPDARQLLEAADKALYRAKSGGRNRTCYA